MNFYRRFIKGYLKVIALLINLIKISNLKFIRIKLVVLFLLKLNRPKMKAFKILKKVFTIVLILTYFNPNREI